MTLLRPPVPSSVLVPPRATVLQKLDQPHATSVQVLLALSCQTGTATGVQEAS